MEVLELADGPVHVPRAHHLVSMHELQVLTLPLRRGIGQAIEIGQDALELHGVRSPYGIGFAKLRFEHNRCGCRRPERPCKDGACEQAASTTVHNASPIGSEACRESGCPYV